MEIEYNIHRPWNYVTGLDEGMTVDKYIEICEDLYKIMFKHCLKSSHAGLPYPERIMDYASNKIWRKYALHTLCPDTYNKVYAYLEPLFKEYKADLAKLCYEL